jgi:2-polyprenyl-6-methoxyphenol hydroxylase-like FAD-dependent oxidoreductase
MKLIETDVLVVGAGPAGLTASALLARAGVRAIGITKYGGTADSPRAHITNQRTVEVLRDLGVEGRLREAAMPQNIMGTQIFATSFAGMELSRTDTVNKARPVEINGVTYPSNKAAARALGISRHARAENPWRPSAIR